MFTRVVWQGVLALQLCSALALAGQSYTVTNLGPIYPNAINDRGDIVGQTREGQALVRLSGGSPQEAGWGVMNSINTARQAVGTVDGQGVFWSPQTGLIPLPVAEPGADTEPLAIGPDGTIVGRSWPYCEDWCDRGPQAMVILPESDQVTLLPDLGGGESVAYAVNASGVITGSSWLPNSQLHAMRCTVGLGCKDLGTLGNVYSEAFGITKTGEIVGSSLDNSGEWGVLRAFAYTDAAGMQPLGFFANWSYSVAYATNDKRHRVGFAVRLNAQQQSVNIAIRWKPDGAAVVLQNWLVNGSGWKLREADAINNLGQIVGIGTFQGEERGFLLTPVTTTQELHAAHDTAR